MDNTIIHTTMRVLIGVVVLFILYRQLSIYLMSRKVHRAARWISNIRVNVKQDKSIDVFAQKHVATVIERFGEILEQDKDLVMNMFQAFGLIRAITTYRIESLQFMQPLMHALVEMTDNFNRIYGYRVQSYQSETNSVLTIELCNTAEKNDDSIVINLTNQPYFIIEQLSIEAYARGMFKNKYVYLHFGLTICTPETNPYYATLKGKFNL